MPTWLLSMFGLGQGLSGAGGLLGSIFNYLNQKKANETNLQIARETNQLNMELADRNMPANRLTSLLQAGVSRGAALNSITGGGQYTAPVLNAPTVQPENIDLSRIGEALERAASIPSNVQQYNLQNEQLESIRQQIEQNKSSHEIEMKLKAEELHNKQLENIEKQFGFDVRKATSDLQSKIVNAAYEHGVSFDDLQTKQDIIDLLGADSLKDLPGEAVMLAISGANDNLKSNIDYQDAVDRHAKHLSDIKMSKEQYKKLRAEVRDYEQEKDAREKEYKLRSLVAQAENILAQDRLTLEDYRHNLEITKDEHGNPKLNRSRKFSEVMKRNWDRLTDVFGARTLAEIISQALRIVR